jgi:hypothetical protein
MADSESGNRPTRKLTVKNFSVIKDATLEFGKITVLIGPQSSGKSLLCKLAYFLGRDVLMKAEDWAKQNISFSAFEESVRKDFEMWFPKGGWGHRDWEMSFSSNRYWVNVSGCNELNAELSISFADEFKQIYDNIQSNRYPDNLYSPALHLRGLAGVGVWDRVTYIPSERTYFVDTGKGYRSLASDPDPLTKAFATLFESSRAPDIKKPRMRRYLKGGLTLGADSWLFAFDDGRVLPLSELSSGTKELLPLFSVLEMYESQRPSSVSASNNLSAISPPSALNFDDFFIEEPEGAIFPDMQQELARYFAELANSDQLRPHFTITTHSPYILSAFNNLIEAGQLASAKPELKDEIARLIPEHYWIKDGDFKAYAIEDKVLKSIVAEDTGLVSANYLDQVSETIGAEFDELLRLGYVES